MANLKKDGTYKKSSNEGKQAAGKTLHPKSTTNKMVNASKNSGGKGGKKI